MNNENNKFQIDIENLFKQNVNDLLSIKELYIKLKEVEEKITQIKYINSNLANKLKKEYENLKKTILDENIQVKLTNDVKTINSKLDANVQEIRNNCAKKSEINILATDKADKITVQELDAKVNSLRDSSPSGVYDTLETLIQAHPTNDGKIYIAGTKWCYHNGSTWVEGGEYQAKVLATGSFLKTNIADGEIDQQR